MSDISLESPDLRLARKRAGLRRMRLVATGLLVAMILVLAGALAMSRQYPWLAWIVAFTEAAVVGAIADWFAVVALFRRPLGLPIPHTALIPRNKDRIGEELGRFVEHNFLTPENVRARLAELDPVGHAATWLADPGHRARLSGGLKQALPRLLVGIDDEAVIRLIGQTVTKRLDGLDMGRLSGVVLSALLKAGQHHAVLDRMLSALALWLDTNREPLKAKVGAQSSFTPRFVDAYVVNRFVDGVIDLTHEIAYDPHHEMRLKFDRLMHDMVDRLREDPAWRARLDMVKADLVGRIDPAALVGTAWHEIKRRLLDGTDGAPSFLEAQLDQAFARFAREVEADPALKGRLGAGLFQLVDLGLIRFRHQVSTLIAEVVRRWDFREVGTRLELEVGRDLQYIRLNGTIVGGLAGLALHALLVLAGLNAL